VDPSGSPISVDAATLARHVAFLAGGRVRVVALDQLLGLAPEVDAAAITFDDGLANFEDLAWPLFERAGLPVTLFVATRRVGADNAWGGPARGVPTLPLLGWDALRRLAGRGLAIGSHSRTHPRLTRAAAGELEDELAGSADDLERELGRRPTDFCYPYGAHDDRVVEAARRVYARAWTTELRALAPGDDALRLPRLDATYFRAPGRLERWGSPAFRSHLWARGAARRLRQALGPR
jgi:peptidoglycan/xylan/chitin deacetylase (PgdA/CDA1 family)